MSQEVFRYKAIEPNTQWEIWYDIIPYVPFLTAGHSLTDPEIINLPQAFIQTGTMKISAGFDKYPLGMLSAEVIKPTLNIHLIAGVAKYIKCINALRNPKYSYGNLVVGTIHRITRYNGTDAKIIFEGIQNRFAEKDDLISNIMELEVQCARKVLLEQLPLSSAIGNYLAINHISEASTEIEWARYILEKIHIIDAEPHIYLSDASVEFPGINKFMMARYDSFLSQISGVYWFWLVIALRTGGETVTEWHWKFDIVKYYSQVDMSAALGDYLPHYTPSRYLIAGVLQENEAEYDKFVNGEVNANNLGGLFNINDEDGLNGKWTNMWDFLVDFFESNLCKCLPSYSRSKLMTMGFMETSIPTNLYDASEYQTITIPKHKLVSAVLDNEIFGDSVVTVSLIEAAPDDIESYEATTPNSRNSSEYQLPMVFNNIPRVNTSSLSHYDAETIFYFYGDLGYTAPLYMTTYESVSSVHFFDIYYLHDAPSAFRFARVHEYCDVKLSENVYVSDLVPFEPISELTSLIEIQRDSTKTKIFGDALHKVLNNPLRRQMIIKLRFDKENDFMHYLEAFYTNYNINMSELGDGLSVFGNNWIATNVEVDLELGISEITLLNRLNMV